MTNPYHVLWPYLHTIPPLTQSRENVPLLHTNLTTHVNPICTDVTPICNNDMDSVFATNQYISNIAYQQQKQPRLQNHHPHHHHHQHHLNRQSSFHQYHHIGRDVYLQKMGYELNSNISISPVSSSSNSPMGDTSNHNNNHNHNNANNTDKKTTITKTNNSTTPIPPNSKRCHSFTIDYILNNDKNNHTDVTNHESNDEYSTTKSNSPLKSSDSIHDMSGISSPISPRDANTPSPSPATGCSPSPVSLLPIMHSTPNIFNSENSRFVRRNDRFTEATHPYFHKLDFLNHGDQRYHSLQQQQSQHHPHDYPHHPHHQHPLQPHNASTRSSFDVPSVNSSSTSFSSSSESTKSPQNDKKEDKVNNKTKRIRTIFTPDQLERLEAEFERQQYMVGTERFYLASSLHLTEAQVKVWFQNRRIKWRKQHLEQQQARLAQGDLYRDLEESEESDVEDEPMTSMTSSGQLEGNIDQSLLQYQESSMDDN